MNGEIDHYNQLAGDSFDSGQSMLAYSHQLCLSRFVFHCGQSPPLTVLDLGSGTGRFSPNLAEAFGGQVFGVEPSDTMRIYADTHRPHQSVSYLSGRAESIPLGDASCDLAILYEVVHHVEDRAAMAAELARVLRPGGRLIIGTQIHEQECPPSWAKYFPRAHELHKPKLPVLEELCTTLSRSGLDYVAHESVDLCLAQNLKTYRERMSHLAISALVLLSRAELELGFKLMDAEIASGVDSPVNTTTVLVVAQRREDMRVKAG